MMNITEQQILDNAAAIREILGMDTTEVQEQMDTDTQEPKAEKVKCKVCGFHKRARRVGANGVCKVCAEAVKDSPESVEVIGRMGKRGRNNVSVMIDGKRFKVKRLSPKHSERIAAKYASKGKGYAKKPAHKSAPPKGLPTSSRLPGDERA